MCDKNINSYVSLKRNGLQYSVIQNEEIFLSGNTKYLWLTYLLNEFLNTLHNMLVELENSNISVEEKIQRHIYLLKSCNIDSKNRIRNFGWLTSNPIPTAEYAVFLRTFNSL